MGWCNIVSSGVVVGFRVLVRFPVLCAYGSVLLVVVVSVAAGFWRGVVYVMAVELALGVLGLGVGTWGWGVWWVWLVCGFWWLGLLGWWWLLGWGGWLGFLGFWDSV